jgi:NADH-quinone oxidoreductase subunit L
MVAAGVYMLFRVQLSIGADAFDNFAGQTIAWIGGITALCAALMATQQNDIKRILAYSTLSQLGYMVMAVGLLAGEAGMFHLFTHAWFKALLFLGAGAVIHACHHQQDIWKMGGLLQKMPKTGYTFLIGFLALIAVPGTAGFFSKEMILHAAEVYGHKAGNSMALFWIAAVVAVLTPFYMTRLFMVAFLGKPRSKDADHAHEVGPLMWVPLAVLALLALFGGYKFAHGLAPAVPADAGEFHVNLVLWVSLIALVVGAGAGYALYNGKDKDPVSIPFFRDRFRIDDLYDKVLVKYFQDAFAAIVNFFDEVLINGLIVGGSTRVAESFGGLFRRVQGGNLQGYAFAFGIGVILVIYFTAF